MIWTNKLKNEKKKGKKNTHKLTIKSTQGPLMRAWDARKSCLIYFYNFIVKKKRENKGRNISSSL